MERTEETNDSTKLETTQMEPTIAQQLVKYAIKDVLSSVIWISSGDMER